MSSCCSQTLQLLKLLLLLLLLICRNSCGNLLLENLLETRICSLRSGCCRCCCSYCSRFLLLLQLQLLLLLKLLLLLNEYFLEVCGSHQVKWIGSCSGTGSGYSRCCRRGSRCCELLQFEDGTIEEILRGCSLSCLRRCCCGCGCGSHCRIGIFRCGGHIVQLHYISAIGGSQQLRQLH